jgi:hypothetical protein
MGSFANALAPVCTGMVLCPWLPGRAIVIDVMTYVVPDAVLVPIEKEAEAPRRKLSR